MSFTPALPDMRPLLPRWQGLLQDLIRIPSVFENDQKICAFVYDYLIDLGVPDTRKVLHTSTKLAAIKGAEQPFSDLPDRYSVVVKLGGTGGGKSLIYNAHLDVAEEGEASSWTYPPFLGYIDRDKNLIYGRGAMDDKSGVLICLALIELLKESREKPKGDIYFHLVLEDEITGNGTLLCLETGPKSDAALIIDGTRLDRAIREHAGQLEFLINLTGSPASVSVHHVGINAVEKLAELAMALKDSVHSLNEGRHADWQRFPAPYQCSIQAFNGRGARFTLPKQASANFYLTFCPPHTVAEVKQLVLSTVLAYAEKNNLPEPPSVAWSGFALEPVRSMSDELEGLLQRCAQQSGIDSVEIGPSTGTSDLRHYVKAGIPGLLYGPGRGYNPHRPDEYFHLEDLQTMISVYWKLAWEWCN